MATDISAPLPQLDLAPGAFIVVDALDAAARVTRLTVSGTFYPPAQPTEEATPLLAVLQEDI